MLPCLKEQHRTTLLWNFDFLIPCTILSNSERTLCAGLEKMGMQMPGGTGRAELPPPPPQPESCLGQSHIKWAEKEEHCCFLSSSSTLLEDGRAVVQRQRQTDRQTDRQRNWKSTVQDAWNPIFYGTSCRTPQR